MKSFGPYIHLLEEEEEGYLPGWYFSDETSELEGPFSSRPDAEIALEMYVKGLNAGLDQNKKENKANV